jgi:hypothetical protein
VFYINQISFYIKCKYIKYFLKTKKAQNLIIDRIKLKGFSQYHSLAVRNDVKLNNDGLCYVLILRSGSSHLD